MYTEQDKKFLQTLKSQGVGKDEAFQRLNAVKAKSTNSGSTSKSTSTPESEHDYFGKSVVDFFGGALQGAATVGANAAATVGEGIGNTIGAAGQVASYLDPIADAGRISKTLTGSEGVFEGYKSPTEQIGGGVQEGMKSLADTTRKSIEESTGNGQDSLPAQAGNVLGTGANIIASSALGGEAGTQLAGKAATLIPGAGKAASVAKTLLPSVGGSLGSTEGVVAATEGRAATPGELGTGLAIDGAVGLASKAAEKLGNYFFKKIIPTTPSQAAKDAARGFDLGETLADETGMSMTREAVQKKVASKIKSLSDEMDEIIKAADEGDTLAVIHFGEQAGFTADDLFPEGSVDQILKDKKLKLKFGDIEGVNSQITTTLDEFKQTLGDKTLTLSEVQNLKKKLGSSLAGLYSKTGDAKATAKELVNDMIRKNAKTIIEENVAGAAEINKRLAPLITINNRMTAKGPYSGYLTDLLAGLGTGSTGQGAGDYAKNALFGIMAKRALTSTAAKTVAGTALRNAPKVAPIVSAVGKTAVTEKN